ncbi:MAG: CBS domain-containing protein [Woeseiaceae bacterium]
MTMDPLTVGPDDSAATAKELLESKDIHHLPVVQDGVLVGILSASDFLKLHVLRDRPRALEAIQVKRIMQSAPTTLTASADLIDVAAKLSDGSFHALPVVDSDNVLVGIVTSTDLINHLLMQIPRGDGSMHKPRPEESRNDVSDEDMAAAIRQAKQSRDSGTNSKLEDVALRLRDQNRLLKEACTAAELYLRSGMAEREHSVLQECLLKVRQVM